LTRADTISAWHLVIEAESANMTPAEMRRYFIDHGFAVSDDVVFEDDQTSPDSNTSERRP
jgi:hypothetical protein